MAKTKTRDEVMSEAYWTPKEKEDMNSKYSTNLLKENCNQEELSDKSWPSDAYVVTYKIDDEFVRISFVVMLRLISLTCTMISLGQRLL